MPRNKKIEDKTSKVDICSNDQSVRTTLAPLTMNEHDKVYSRTLRRDLEIGVGMHGTDPKGGKGGLVPKNPFASLAQAGYMHSHPEVLGKTALSEWDAASKGRKIPQHVKKSGK
jgi:hypothetical protein